MGAIVELRDRRAAREHAAEARAIGALAAAIAALPPATLDRIRRLAERGTLADALRREFESGET